MVTMTSIEKLLTQEGKLKVGIAFGYRYRLLLM